MSESKAAGRYGKKAAVAKVAAKAEAKAEQQPQAAAQGNPAVGQSDDIAAQAMQRYGSP